MDDLDLTKLTFLQAIEFFRQKLSLPVADWEAIQGAEADWAFAVATVSEGALLDDLRVAVDRYIAEGTNFEQFAAEFNQVADRYGWRGASPWRASLIASTNLRMAYAAGQFQQRQTPIVKRLRPGLKWVHRDSPNPRSHHLALDGKVFDGSDPEYAGLSAPSGFGCRCRIFSVPAPKDEYFELSDRLPYPRSDGTQIEIPAVPTAEGLKPIADRGFYHPPGSSPISDRPAILQTMLGRLSPKERDRISKLLDKKGISYERST